MDDAVVAQVGVDRHDGQVVLEAGVGSDWKMAKVFKFWAKFFRNAHIYSELAGTKCTFMYSIASYQDDSITALVHSAALPIFGHALGIFVI